MASQASIDWNRLLDGKVAVVTGGGDGIGGAISRLFAEHGALVEIAEIDAGAGRRGRAPTIEAAGGTVRAHVVDVTKEDDVARLADAVLSVHGHIDVLVNNVGDYRPWSASRLDAGVVEGRCTTSTCSTSSPSPTPSSTP